MPKELSRRNLRICHQLVDRFMDSLVNEMIGTIGMRVCPDTEDPEADPNGRRVLYDLHIFEGRMEFVGGATDGETTFHGYSLNLSEFLSFLGPMLGPKSIPATVFFDNECQDAGKPVLCVIGSYQGRNFRVHIHSVPPEHAIVTAHVHLDKRIEYLEPADLEKEDDD